MSGYQRVKTWSLGRAWRNNPLSLLHTWRADHSTPTLFKLKGESYLLCEASHLISMLDQRAYEQLNQGKEVEQTFVQELKLQHWLPLLQRFFSVSLTPLLERQDHSPIALEELIDAPFTAALAHLLFGIDIRKTSHAHNQKIYQMFETLEQAFKIKDARIRQRGVPPWQQRSLRKRYRQLAPFGGLLQSLTLDQGLKITYQAFEWRRQVIDTLVWFFVYLDQLSRLSNRGGKIFEELTTTLESRAYQADDLSRLPTLHKLLLETLRVAPPHWVTSWGEASTLIREEIFLREFGGLPPHTQLITSPFIDHYQTLEWPSPHSFVAHRFLATIHGAPLPPTFLPCGVGARGREILMLTLHTLMAISASILRRGQIHHLQLPEEINSIASSSDSNTAGLFFEQACGASFGSPQLKVSFEVDERYIHIPSARV